MRGFDFIIDPIENNSIGDVRRACISKAKGSVLEIGIGSGANLPFYIRKQVSTFVAIDANVNRKIKNLSAGEFKVIKGSAQSLPFSDSSFDTVVATLLLCSVDSPNKALEEIKRVLKPGGKYIFIEHILPESAGLANLFNLLNPLWSKMARGCNLNRNTHDTISRSGLKILNIQKKWKTIGCFGIAEKPL